MMSGAMPMRSRGDRGLAAAIARSCCPHSSSVFLGMLNVLSAESIELLARSLDVSLAQVRLGDREAI